MFVLYEFLGRRSFIEPICCNFYMVLSMFFRLVLANSLFSLRDINLTLGLLPPRRHLVWRDSVSVRSSGSGLKSECADNFSSEPDLWLLRYTEEPQRGRNSCLWLQSRSVLSSFSVMLMSCRVPWFSRSTISIADYCIAVFCLQNLTCLHYYFCWSGLYRSWCCLWIFWRCKKFSKLRENIAA